ncbi:MAG TPA: CpsD/CapB family tyrosine-protein kinase, partial [Anaerolineae bacterium]|nr:CpsD/CapB family tyrosine-protein kinase [Anaerolineae bacterium]
MEKIITLKDPTSPAAEAYRALRVNLMYATLDQPVKTLVIAAPATEDNAPVPPDVAVNLAVVAAQAGQRVILVDADLRHPLLHVLFGVPNADGLTQAILELEEKAALPLVETAVPGLRLLTTGKVPPNPSDILSSHKMAELLERLKAQADLVILQAPPVLVAVDAAALAAQADGMVLSVRSGKTRRDRIESAKKILERYQVHLLGAVLTDA